MRWHPPKSYEKGHYEGGVAFTVLTVSATRTTTLLLRREFVFPGLFVGAVGVHREHVLNSCRPVLGSSNREVQPVYVRHNTRCIRVYTL